MGDLIISLLLIAIGIIVFIVLLKTSGNKSIKKTEIPSVAVSTPVIPETDDLELIAVITAAIAASLNVSTDKFVVRSIKKMDRWSDAARRDVYFRGDK